MNLFDSQAASALRKAAFHCGLNHTDIQLLSTELRNCLHSCTRHITQLLLYDAARPLPLAAALPLAFGYAFTRGIEGALLWQAERLDDLEPLTTVELWRGHRRGSGGTRTPRDARCGRRDTAAWRPDGTRRLRRGDGLLQGA